MTITEVQTTVHSHLIDDLESFYVNSASNIVQRVSSQGLLAAGGPGIVVGAIFQTLSYSQQYNINLSQASNGQYEASIAALGYTIADASLNVVIAGAIAAGAISIGATVGFPLAVAAYVGSALFMEINHDITQAWRDAVTEVVARLDENGIDGLAGLFADEAESILEYLDGLLGTPDDPYPVSEFIAEMASWFESLEVTPLVVDLGGNGLDLVAESVSSVFFDIDADGFAEKTGWTGAADAFLVRDTNANGIIDSQAEMFGDNGGTSAFAKLAALDADSSGKLTGAELNGIQLWRDLDQDGKTDSGELFTLASYNIAQIDVTKQAHTATVQGHTVDGKISLRDSSGIATHTAYDVFFQVDQVNSWYLGNKSEISAETLFEPLSRGYGNVKSLHFALSEDTVLAAQLDSIAMMSLSTQMTLVDEEILDLLAIWSDQEGVAADSRPRVVNGNATNYVNGQMLGIVEEFVGEEFVNINAQTTPDSIGSSRLHNAMFYLGQTIKERVLVQTLFSDIFLATYYDFATDSLVIGDAFADILDRADTLAPVDAAQAKAFWGHLAGILVTNKAQFSMTESAVLSAVELEAGMQVDHYTTHIRGSNTVEDFRGTSFADSIFVFDGNDTVDAGDGNDYVHGGNGNDFVDGYFEFDTLVGGDGNDTLRGGSGDDKLYGDAGADSLNGGNDNDTIYGGAANDTIVGDSGLDVLYGEDGADSITAGNANDVIYGGAGNDTILDGQDIDSIFGGAGDDVIRLLADSDVDRLIYTAVSESSSLSGAQGDFVEGFVKGKELIDLSALGYTSFSQLSIAVVSGDTRIQSTLGDGFRLTLDGSFTLAASDFIFA